MLSSVPYIIGGKVDKGAPKQARNKKYRHRKIYVLNVKRIVFFTIAVILLVATPVGVFVYRRSVAFLLPSETFYYIQIFSSEEGKKADALAAEVVEKGGAGYILNDGTFRIMASVYDNYEDAETIRLRLVDKYSDCMIYEVKVPKLNISKFANRELAAKIFPIIKESQKALFDSVRSLDFSLDKGELSQAAILKSVTEIKDRLSERKRELRNIKNDYPTERIVDLSVDYLDNVSAIIEGELPMDCLIIGNKLKLILCRLCSLYNDTVKLFLDL